MPFFLLLPTLPAIATEVAPLLACLAQEEAIIHKERVTSPLYPLNQFFINELSASSNPTLKEGYYRSLCGRGPQGASLGLMELFLTRGASIFVEESHFEALEGDILRIFFNFVAHLQSEAPRARCLVDTVPDLGNLMDRYRYLEELGPRRWAQQHRAPLGRILQSLKKPEALYRRCATPE